MRDERLGKQERAIHVHGHRLFKIALLGFKYRLAAENAGNVQQRVDMTVLFHYVIRELRHGDLVSDVNLAGLDFGLGEALFHGVGRVDVHIAENYAALFFHKALHDGAADVAAAAGNYDDMVFDIHCHDLFPPM